MNINEQPLYIVTKPTEQSELVDVLIVTTLNKLHLQILGAKDWESLEPEYFDNELEAIRTAHKKLDKAKLKVVK